MPATLQSLLEELEQDPSLYEPERLRERIDALDRLDVFHVDHQTAPTSNAGNSAPAETRNRAKALCAKLEAANLHLYRTIRDEIQRGAGPASLLRWALEPAPGGLESDSPCGQNYDYLDDLLNGVLQFEMPIPSSFPLAPEMVFYQPTPARHIFDLLRRTALTTHDVLVDLGSGLGHVPLLASICTSASSIGIELEPAYVHCAQKSAQALNLRNAAFFQQDVRVADFSTGTVFYLYTPFTGTILREVLASLKREATHRGIRICTFGPCSTIVAAERWLTSTETVESDRIALFNSGS